MDPKDDTVDTSRQANEDAYFAMVEAGLMPGITNNRVSSAADLQRVIEKGREQNADTLVAVRIPRKVVEFGFYGGVSFYDTVFAPLSDDIEGHIILSFDGWQTLDNPDALELTGGAFLISHAFPERLIKFENGVLFFDLYGVHCVRSYVFQDD